MLPKTEIWEKSELAISNCLRIMVRNYSGINHHRKYYVILKLMANDTYHGNIVIDSEEEMNKHKGKPGIVMLFY